MKKIVKTRIFAAGLLLMVLTSSLPAQEELNTYLVTAATNNPALKAKFNDYMAALEQVPQARALPDPQFAFGYFIMPVETRMGPQLFKLSASQMFPWFGTLKARENASVQSAQAKYELFEESRSDLYNSVKATYFNLYFNQKAIDITGENIDILKSLRNMATVKLEAGLVSSVDELRVEIEIGELENQLSLLLDNREFLRVMFNNLLNVDNDEPIYIPQLLWEDDFPLAKEEAIDSVLAKNHHLLSLGYQQESLLARQQVAADMGKPSFNIGLDYSIIGKGSNNMAGTDAFMFPNIGITVPLYRSRYKAMVQEVVYMSTAKEEEAADKINMLETLFEKGWKEYRDADRRIELYNVQLSLARKSLRLLEIDYTNAGKNFEEVLRMERMVLRFSLELEKARADKQAAIAFIYYLMGQ